MKFKCEKCSTRYTIADDKIRRKVLKIRCKICEHVIIVRDPNPGSAADASPAPRVAGIFQPQSSVSGDAEDRTVITDALGPLLDLEWYAAPGGEQVGPMPFERLRDMIKRAEVGGDDVVWNETMGDWTAVRDLPQLADLLHERHPPPPPLPPSVRRPSPPAVALAPLGGASSTPAPAGTPAPSAGLGLDLSQPPSQTGGFGLDLSEPPPSIEPAPVEQPSATPAPRAPLFSDGLFDEPALPPPEENDTEAHPALGPPMGEDHAPLFPDQAGGTHEAVAAPIPPPQTPAPTAPAPGHEIMGTSELRALTTPPSRNFVPIAIGLLLLAVGVGLGIMLAPGGGTPPPVAAAPPIATAPPKAAPPAVSATPAKAPVKKPATPVVAATPDAGATPEKAAPVPAKPAPAVAKTKPKRVRKPSPDAAPKRPKRPAAGRFGALDHGKTRVSIVTPSGPTEALPDTITQGQILSVIKRHQRGVRTCYERQLKRNDSMQSAKIMLRFSIQGSGRTSNVRLSRRFDGTVLKTCLTALVGRWRFPKFSGEAIPVEYPLVLQASL